MQVYTDSHVSTKFYWARPHVLSPESSATITWDIPEGIPAGAFPLPKGPLLCQMYPHDPLACSLLGALQMGLRTHCLLPDGLWLRSADLVVVLKQNILHVSVAPLVVYEDFVLLMDPKACIIGSRSQQIRDQAEGISVCAISQACIGCGTLETTSTSSAGHRRFPAALVHSRLEIRALAAAGAVPACQTGRCL